jgi:hypothetical protein
MADEGRDSQSERTVRATTWLVLGSALVLVLGSFALRCSPATGRVYPSRTLPPEPPPTLLPTPTSEDFDDYFPCSDCHEGEEVNRQRRELEDEHEDLKLEHGNLWCLDCHDADDRDRLHRADAEPVAFEDSWQLCVQCHGHKLAEWRAGVHGKRTGHWWGTKEYRPCVSCHDPHAPHFKPLKPEPPPVRPAQVPSPAIRLEEVFDATR